MVNTVKMSQFIGADLTVTTNKLVGVSSLLGGYNFQTSLINTWTTSTRPSPPYPGLSGYNSTTKEPEFWNGTAWISLTTGTGTVNPALINQLAWYASTGNSVSGLATIANGVLVTSAGSVPSISTTLPSGLTIPGYQTSLTFPLAMSLGGTNANLTATNNNLVYSTASALALLATANNGVLVTSNTGVPSISTTLPSGLIIPSPLISYSNGQNIKDNNGNQLLAFNVIASAVNYVAIANAPTLGMPNVFSAGSDTNIILQLNGKGTGGVIVQGSGTNTAIPSGYIGEIRKSVIIRSSAISITNNTATDLTSITLDFGKWIVWGNINYQTATQNLGNIFAWISSASATLPDVSLVNEFDANTGSLFGNAGISAPQQSFAVSGSTTIFVTGMCNFGSGSVVICGGIYAMRVG